MCTCKGKNKRPVDKQWKEKMQRAYERGIKHISMIDMASIAYGKRHDKPQDKKTNKKVRRQTSKQANKKKDKQVRKKTKGGVRKGRM